MGTLIELLDIERRLMEITHSTGTGLDPGQMALVVQARSKIEQVTMELAQEEAVDG